MMAEPAIPASEFMDDSRSLQRRDPVASDGPHLKCPQCDTRLNDGHLVSTWVCRRANCPTPSVVEGGVRL
jgi:hypothetical protein